LTKANPETTARHIVAGRRQSRDDCKTYSGREETIQRRPKDSGREDTWVRGTQYLHGARAARSLCHGLDGYQLVVRVRGEEKRKAEENVKVNPEGRPTQKRDNLGRSEDACGSSSRQII